MNSRKDKVVISGAGAGIGRAAALLFADAAARVVITGRRSLPEEVATWIVALAAGSDIASGSSEALQEEISYAP